MNLLLSLFYYFYFSVVGIYVIFLPKVLLTLGYSGSEIGILLGAAPLVRFLLPFVFMRGFVLNTRVFHLALLLKMIAVVLFVLYIRDFWVLLCVNILLGMGLSLVLPYMEMIALDSIGKERYGKVRLFGSVGFIVIALVLAHFVSNYVAELYWLVALVYLSVVFGYLVEKFAKKTQSHTAKQEHYPIDLLADWKLWAGLTMMQVSFGSFYNFFTIYATQHGISLDMTVYLWSFGVLVEVAMLFWQGRLLAKTPLLSLIMVSVFATIFRWFLVYAFADNLTVLFVSQSIHALSFALFHSASISYLHQLYKNKSLAQQLFMGFSYGLGGLGGAVISGYIFEYVPTYLFLSSSGFALVSFVLLWLYARQLRADAPSSL